MALPSYLGYPEFPMELSRQASVVFVDEPVGTFRSRAQTHQRPRTVLLTWRILSAADAAALVTIFDSCKGGAGKFLWQCPLDATPSRWEFMVDTLPLVRLTATCYQTSAAIPILESQNADE